MQLKLHHSFLFLFSETLYFLSVGSCGGTLCSVWSWLQAKHDNCCEGSTAVTQFKTCRTRCKRIRVKMMIFYHRICSNLSCVLQRIFLLCNLIPRILYWIKARSQDCHFSDSVYPVSDVNICKMGNVKLLWKQATWLLQCTILYLFLLHYGICKDVEAI